MICYNCFQELNNETICLHCGYNPNNDAGKCPHGLKPGTILNGRYIIGRVIGQGGFGITYIALDYISKERVAIKEFFPEELASRNDDVNVVPFFGDRGENFSFGKESFLNEAKTLAEFRGNVHIVCVHRYFEENGTAYLVMEYVEGVGLDSYMNQHDGSISVDTANKYLLPIMDAMNWVHSKGVVHRDIAPDNILITKNDTAKLIDFGAARYSTGEKSKSLDVILKHGFAPFEQYSRHGKQGPYTDVYALAATYYYAITGKIPPDSIDRINGDQISSPSDFNPTIYPEIEKALLKGLEPIAANRYQTMSDMKSAFDSAISIEEKRQEEKRQEEEKRVREEKAAEEKRIAALKVAEEKRLAAEKAAEKKRIAIEEKRLAAERKKEEAQLAKEKKNTNKEAEAKERSTRKTPNRFRIILVAILLAFIVGGASFGIKSFVSKTDEYQVISEEPNAIDDTVEELVAVADNTPNGLVASLNDKVFISKNDLTVTTSIMLDSVLPDYFEGGVGNNEQDVVFSVDISDGNNTYRLESAHQNTQSGKTESINPSSLESGIYLITSGTDSRTKLEEEPKVSLLLNSCIWTYDILEDMTLNWNSIQIVRYEIRYNDIRESNEYQYKRYDTVSSDTVQLSVDDIVSVEYDSNKCNITLKLEHDLPTEYEVFKEETPLNGCDVMIGVTFTDGVNTYEVCSSHWKHENIPQDSLILSDLQHDLWKTEESESGIKITVVPDSIVDASQSGNTITWTIHNTGNEIIDWSQFRLIDVRSMYNEYNEYTEYDTES